MSKEKVEIVSLGELLLENDAAEFLKEEALTQKEQAGEKVRTPRKPKRLNKKVTIKIEKDPNNPYKARLTFVNTSKEDLTLAKPRLGLRGRFDDEYFTTDNTAVEYIPTRNPKTKYADTQLVLLEPEAEIKSSWIDFQKLYNLSNDELITIRYVAEHPLHDKDKFVQIDSPLIILGKEDLVELPSDVTFEAETLLSEDVTPEPISEATSAPVSEEKVEDPLLHAGKTLPPYNPDEKNFWFFTSGISTLLALIGTVLWIIPIGLFAAFGIIFGIISLKKKEANRNITIVSIIASSLAFLYSIVFYTSILFALTIVNAILNQIS